MKNFTKLNGLLFSRMSLGAKKNIVNLKWGKQCAEYELNATAGWVKENGNPAYDVSLSWNKTPPGIMQSLHMMICVMDPAVNLSRLEGRGGEWCGVVWGRVG